MARGFQFGQYSSDSGSTYAMRVQNDAFADANRGWTTPAAGMTLLPRGYKPRHVQGISPTTGFHGKAIIATTASDLWTGAASTFDVSNDDGSGKDTLNVTSRVGEKALVSH